MSQVWREDGAASWEEHWRKDPRFCAQEVEPGERGLSERCSVLSVLPPTAQQPSGPCCTLVGAGVSHMVLRPTLPPSHTRTRPAAFPAPNSVPPTIKPFLIPASALSGPLLISALRTFPASSPALSLLRAFPPAVPRPQTLTSGAPPPVPSPSAAPLGKASLGPSTSSTLGPTSFPASPRRGTTACANTPGTGPGTGVERALGLGTAGGWELSGAAHSATVGIGC